jgi:undecaprenyl-diphosphatase
MIAAPPPTSLMPHWLDAMILGLIEGLTEFIPVSSTAHLLIAEKFLKLKESDVFNIVIQGGAVLAVIPLFWKQFSGMIFGLREAKNRDLLAKLVVAFVITAGVGYVLDKRGFKLPDQLEPVAWALVVGGLVIFWVEFAERHTVPSNTLTWPLAVAFGLAQLVAMIFPGASRSGSTIMLAMLLGMARPAATEFSFLLGVPSILAASGWKLLKALKGTEAVEGHGWAHITVGFVVAAVSSFFVVKWLIRYVQTHTFNSFAIYRVVAGVALLVWMGAR